MNLYVSTFISGLQQAIAEIIITDYNGIDIVKVLDGLILYKTSQDISEIKSIKFFNNTFLVIKDFSDLRTLDINPVLQSITELQLHKVLPDINLLQQKKTFRVVVSKENEFVAADKKLIRKIEKSIVNDTHFSVDRSNPDIEFWVLIRSEKRAFFLLRLTSHTAYEKVLRKGELRPELAYILCALSEPEAEDVFLDPFCGSGAIPLQRACFPYKQIFATDNDRSKIKILKSHLKKQDRELKQFYPQVMDAHHLDFFKDNSLDKIVTDPPWGVYEDLPMNISKFYFMMLLQFIKKIKPDGIIIILTARKQEFEKVAARFKKKLELEEKYNILVSGKKAGIYKLRRS